MKELADKSVMYRGNRLQEPPDSATAPGPTV